MSPAKFCGVWLGRVMVPVTVVVGASMAAAIVAAWGVCTVKQVELAAIVQEPAVTRLDETAST